VRSLDSLIFAAENTTLQIGKTLKGRKVREVVRENPAVLDTWAKGKGAPPQMRMLSAYAKAIRARQLLEDSLKPANNIKESAAESPTPVRPNFLPPMEYRPDSGVRVLEQVLVVTAGAMPHVTLDFIGHLFVFWSRWYTLVGDICGLCLGSPDRWAKVLPFFIAVCIVIAFFPQIWDGIVYLSMDCFVCAVFFGTATGIGGWMGKKTT